MKISKLKLIPMAALAMLGTIGNAYAGAYAVSYNQVTNLIITNDPNITFSPASSSVNSSASACLPNSTCVTNGGAGVLDAPHALIGATVPAYVENSYGVQPVFHSATPTSFSLADASVDSQQTAGAPFTSARSMAEGKLVGSNTANGTAGNSSGTLFTSTFVVGGAGGTVSFQFDADPFLRALLTAGSVPPASADTTMSVVFSISQVGVPGTVFNWAPDGAAGGISGGVELTDAFTLNTTLVALPGAEGPFTYDPGTCPVGAPGLPACFSAVTSPLVAGTYTLNLAMRNTVNLQSVIPEPGILALMGIGMIGICAARRRKEQA